MIFLILVFVIAVMIYSDFYSYDFLNSLLNDDFGLIHIIVLVALFMVILINIILNLQMQIIDKQNFRRFFQNEEDFHKHVRKRFLYNSIGRFLLILILPLFGYMTLYLFEKVNLIDIGFAKWVLFFIIGFAAIITFVVFYVTDILFPMNILMCGEIGFFGFCKKCHYGGMETYKEAEDHKDGFITYRCKNCGNEIKIEKIKHVFNEIFRHIHLHRHR